MPYDDVLVCDGILSDSTSVTIPVSMMLNAYPSTLSKLQGLVFVCPLVREYTDVYVSLLFALYVDTLSCVFNIIMYTELFPGITAVGSIHHVGKMMGIF